jgi:hypothetical protein
VRWGTDATMAWTRSDGWVWVFACIHHYTRGRRTPKPPPAQGDSALSLPWRIAARCGSCCPGAGQLDHLQVHQLAHDLQADRGRGRQQPLVMCAAEAARGSSTRPASHSGSPAVLADTSRGALLWGRVVAGGMSNRTTSVPWAPVQVATQDLSADSAVDCGRGVS